MSAHSRRWQHSPRAGRFAQLAFQTRTPRACAQLSSCTHAHGRCRHQRLNIRRHSLSACRPLLVSPCTSDRSLCSSFGQCQTRGPCWRCRGSHRRCRAGATPPTTPGRRSACCTSSCYPQRTCGTAWEWADSRWARPTRSSHYTRSGRPCARCPGCRCTLRARATDR